MTGRGTILVVGLVALSCACSSQLPTPSVADLRAAEARWKNATLPELERGRELYVANCAGCHDLILPHEKAPDSWSDIIDEMRTEEEVELTDEEATAIERYLFGASTTAG